MMALLCASVIAIGPTTFVCQSNLGMRVNIDLAGVVYVGPDGTAEWSEAIDVLEDAIGKSGDGYIANSVGCEMHGMGWVCWRDSFGNVADSLIGKDNFLPAAAGDPA